MVVSLRHHHMAFQRMHKDGKKKKCGRQGDTVRNALNQMYIASEREAERNAAIEAPCMVAAMPPRCIVGTGAIAHVRVKQVVTVGDIAGKRKVSADVPRKLALDGGVHKAAMIKRFVGTLVLHEISRRALGVAEALPN